jgi:hypothetical protein
MFGRVLFFMQLRSGILKVFAYFDLFNYPLSIEEVHYYLETATEEYPVRKEVEMLIKEGRLFRTGQYVSLRNDPALEERRNRGRIHADNLLLIANKGAHFLFQFPFVRGVCISGSLSKRCADEKADIDYFIITRADRLWIARTLMHLFKKLTFLIGHQHRYCMNYYIDEKALEIKEKNIFTATELLTLMPASGNGGLTRFFNANDWASAWYPQYRHRTRTAETTPKSSLLKRCAEWLLDNRIGNYLDDYLRNLTARRWKIKEQRGDLTMRGIKMSLQCGKHYSRPNPEHFQQKVLHRYYGKVKELTATHPPISS